MDYRIIPIAPEDEAVKFLQSQMQALAGDPKFDELKRAYSDANETYLGGAFAANETGRKQLFLAMEKSRQAMKDLIVFSVMTDAGNDC